jgi:hydrogenase expression/formation protein HypE
VLRDPTRGGLAASLNEIAAQSGVCIQIDETTIPIAPAVEAACEMLGFDPLHIANEGKLVAIIPEADAEAVLTAMRKTTLGAGATKIGRVEAEPQGRVLMRTSIGGTRVVEIPAGELLPRIC